MINRAKERIVLTGGTWFLGKYLQKELHGRGVPEKNILISIIDDYDITKEVNVIRMYDDMAPTVII